VQHSISRGPLISVISDQRISGLRRVQLNNYQIVTRGGEGREVKVKVEFDDWDDKQRMGRASPFYQCWLPKQLQYKIVIPRQQYESQKKQWDALGEKMGADDPHVQTRTGERENVSIEIAGKEKKAAGPLKVRVENMIASDKLDSTCWHPPFTLLSRAFFDRGKKGIRLERLQNPISEGSWRIESR